MADTHLNPKGQSQARKNDWRIVNACGPQTTTLLSRHHATTNRAHLSCKRVSEEPELRGANTTTQRTTCYETLVQVKPRVEKASRKYVLAQPTGHAFAAMANNSGHTSYVSPDCCERTGSPAGNDSTLAAGRPRPPCPRMVRGRPPCPAHILHPLPPIYLPNLKWPLAD